MLISVKFSVFRKEPAEEIRPKRIIEKKSMTQGIIARFSRSWNTVPRRDSAGELHVSSNSTPEVSEQNIRKENKDFSR